jgi:hypothetical protein
MKNFERLRERLAAIELDLDAGRYKAGPWQALIDELRARPDDDRASLADEVSRVSRKLHLRSPRKTISIEAATGLELAATLIGCVMLLASLWTESNILAIVGAAVRVTTFQPLLKVAVGRALGVGYDYAYLYGGLEPRFKMNYGSYLAAARPARVLLHLSGTIGSPLAAEQVGTKAFRGCQKLALKPYTRNGWLAITPPELYSRLLLRAGSSSRMLR